MNKKYGSISKKKGKSQQNGSAKHLKKAMFTRQCFSYAVSLQWLSFSTNQNAQKHISPTS
jgi:hypothetical protein